MDFVEVEPNKGQVLGETILRNHNVSPADMRGQCYDGASNVARARAGVESVVRRDAPKTMYVHCAKPLFSLPVINIQEFKNAESYVGEIATFFSFSPKQQQLLEKAIEASNTTPQGKKLKDSCGLSALIRSQCFLSCFRLFTSVFRL